MNSASQNDMLFEGRHIGLNHKDQEVILNQLQISSLEKFIGSVIPQDIYEEDLSLSSFPKGCNEILALEEIAEISKKNEIRRSLIGLGYYGTALPAVIQRHVLENPIWYTAYTPYQAEISQGRLEALFNFQTLITELTGLPIANASLLDEATAAAEAMSVAFNVRSTKNSKRFLVDKDVFPQTFDVLKTRAEPLGINLKLVDPELIDSEDDFFAVFLQLPGKTGRIWNPSQAIDQAHKAGAILVVAIDPLFQVLIKPLGELDVDIVVGSTQRLGVPIGFGGPHAAFFASKVDFKRQVPGRIVGKSIDVDGTEALRLALQTREQHIRRDKATSNICTAQVLLAVIASFYAVYHGPEGLTNIASRIVKFRQMLVSILIHYDYLIEPYSGFDTVEVYCPEAPLVHAIAASNGINFRVLPLGAERSNANGFGITLDELSTEKEIIKINKILAEAKSKKVISHFNSSEDSEDLLHPIPLRRNPWLQQPAFSKYHSETELMRYINTLANKDFSLVQGMIPLGSCTMKLNAAAELLPIEWKEFSTIHPFVTKEQCGGYQHLIHDLERWLCALTGFDGVSLQPNAGSQGELAGLLVIRAWHESRDQKHRNICLIPTSAHGTNPASAVMSGFKVLSIDCDEFGNIDLEDLRAKSTLYSSQLAALMVTYPSTHGVFEPEIKEICAIVHSQGGQVYLDGANMNAQVGICRPGNYGADVCHLNLHKTFSIPHGGGGPGIGPIAVASHLVPYLPGHSLVNCGGRKSISAVSAAPFGSAGVLPISWMYIRMMGIDGLRKASSLAILSANYIANKLDPYYPILFKGPNGFIAHECILDLRHFKKAVGIEVEDISKRLMDYGFHAPTVSWPVAGTMMVEPTESESLEELNRFCQAMISIRLEIQEIEDGVADRDNNLLKNAPHTLSTITSDNWDRPYSRNLAAFPMPNQRINKFWPAVSRIKNAYGDRNLVCSCSAVEEFSEN